MADLIALPEEWWPAFKRGFTLILVVMPIPMGFAVLRYFEAATAMRDVGVASLIVLIGATIGGLGFALPALVRGFFYRWLRRQ